MQIRRVQLADKAAVQALIDTVWQDDYIMPYFDDWVNNLEDGIFLAAWQDERLLGIAGAVFLSPRVAWLQALRVSPAARRLGLGSALTRACLQYSAQAGRQVARLLIDIDNLASLTLTSQAGFRQVATWLRLEKRPETMVAPPMRQPTLDELPQLLQSVAAHDVTLWQTDWNTYDLNLAALQVSYANDTLRVLTDRPLATMLDIFYDEADQEYKTYNPFGEWPDVEGLLQAMEKEAAERAIPLVCVLLDTDSPHLTSIQKLGYEFSLIKDQAGNTLRDGLTLWEYDLTAIAAEQNR